MATARKRQPTDTSASGHHDSAIRALHATDEETERHTVTGCGICDTDLETFREAAAHLAQAVAATPPAHLKNAVLTKVTQHRHAANRQDRYRNRLKRLFFGARPIQPTDVSEPPMSPPNAEQ